MGVVEITKDNFEEEVIGSMKPVLVDFWADWCGPCKMQSPIVDQVAEEFGDKVKICKCNVDDCPSVAVKYGIISIPTLIYMKEGLFQNKMVGLQSKDTIVAYLNTLID